MGRWFECACGRELVDPAALPRAGWVPTGVGSAVLLVSCPCGRTNSAAVMADASVCTKCRRLLTGKENDVKTVSRSDVLCLPCSVRTLIVPMWQPHRKPVRKP